MPYLHSNKMSQLSKRKSNKPFISLIVKNIAHILSLYTKRHLKPDIIKSDKCLMKSSTRKRYCTIVKHGKPPQHTRKMARKDAQSVVLLLLLSSMSVLSYCKYTFLFY